MVRLKQRLRGGGLQRCKPELRAPIAFDHKHYRCRAQVTHAIKQHDWIVDRSLSHVSGIIVNGDSGLAAVRQPSGRPGIFAPATAVRGNVRP